MSCCTMPTLHTQIHPTPLPMDLTAGELVPVVRKPHRAYPGCDVREFVPTLAHEETRRLRCTADGAGVPTPGAYL